MTDVVLWRKMERRRDSDFCPNALFYLDPPPEATRGKRTCPRCLGRCTFGLRRDGFREVICKRCGTWPYHTLRQRGRCSPIAYAIKGAVRDVREGVKPLCRLQRLDSMHAARKRDKWLDAGIKELEVFLSARNAVLDKHEQPVLPRDEFCLTEDFLAYLPGRKRLSRYAASNMIAALLEHRVIEHARDEAGRPIRGTYRLARAVENGDSICLRDFSVAGPSLPRIVLELLQGRRSLSQVLAAMPEPDPAPT